MAQAAVRTAKLNRWDRIGLILSGICMVHCLALPVFLSTLPLWPVGEALHEWLHPIFALLLVPVTLTAGYAGYRKHRKLEVWMWLSVGLVGVLIAGVWGHLAPGTVAETSLTVSGSVLLIIGHWRNWRLDRCCEEATACTTHETHTHG